MGETEKAVDNIMITVDNVPPQVVMATEPSIPPQIVMAAEPSMLDVISTIAIEGAPPIIFADTRNEVVTVAMETNPPAVAIETNPTTVAIETNPTTIVVERNETVPNITGTVADKVSTPVAMEAVTSTSNGTQSKQGPSPAKKQPNSDVELEFTELVRPK